MRGVTANNRLHRSRRSRGFIHWPAPWRRPVGVTPNMALQRTRRPRFRSSRSLRSLGSRLNARPVRRLSPSNCSLPFANREPYS